MGTHDPTSAHDRPHEGAARLTGDQVNQINRFPDDNPNPVMRIDDDGHLVYANPASAGVLRALGVAVGDLVARPTLARFEAVSPTRGFVELAWDNRTYAVWPIPIRDLGFTNLYGMDVTAERAIVKFPDQNPNPVFRITWDGSLLYSNAASAALISGLGVRIGDSLPEPLRDSLLASAHAGKRETVEVAAAERAYALLPVDVPEFGFVNVYGTDTTAVRERERLASENERLLLNILPGPIAQRLRDGEQLIADRFDDVTLLFADIVGFTQLSATMSPSELVSVLNDVFTVFDGLVDRFGLEKIKTIGDAYMVVGGMTEGSDDHTARVVAMAVELADTIGRLECAMEFGIVFRIGIHCGPVVAGVIGTKKYIYDVWGDTVNLASRMESLSPPGRIQVSKAVMERVGGAFDLEARGPIYVKGKGRMRTYLIAAQAQGV